MSIIRKIINKFHSRIVLKPIIVVKEQSDLLSGKVALVTGGSSGIGFAIAAALVAAGAKVYIIGRNKEKLKNAAEKIGGASFITLDINDVSAMESAIEQFSEKRI